MSLVRKAYQATTCSVRSLATDMLNALKLEIDPFSFRGPTVMDAQSPFFLAAAGFWLRYVIRQPFGLALAEPIDRQQDTGGRSAA